MSKRRGDVDVMEFMVPFIMMILIFYGNVDSGVETWMGTWSNPELARARGVGREPRPFRRFAFDSKDCTE